MIAATNRDLEQEVESGRFRADLFHRLTVYPIYVPALKERDKDVLLIAGYFIERTRRKLGLRQLKLSPEATTSLMTYHWPGNVRELEHLISRASLNAKANANDHDIVVIDAAYLDIQTRMESASAPTSQSTNTTAAFGQSLKQMTEAFQRQCITQALSVTDGNWAQAAGMLHHDRANLMRLAKRLGISVEKRIAITPTSHSND